MAQINIAGAGNADSNINLINPRFQAEALRMLRGYDVGVIDNSFYSSTSSSGASRTPNNNYMWKCTISGSTLTIGRGMATAYGYDIQSESDVVFTLPTVASGYKWVFIYLEWDLHDPSTAVGSIKMWDNGASDTWTPPAQDNLITNPVGTYQMILHRIFVTSAGAVQLGVWTAFGIHTIGYPLRAKNANHAENADEATHAARATNADQATNSTNAQYCQGYQSYGTIHNRLVNIVTRLNEMGFKQGSLSLNTGNGAIYKLGNFVIGYLSYVATRTDIGTIPDGFRPYSDKQITGLVSKNYNSSKRIYEYYPINLSISASTGAITSGIVSSGLSDSQVKTVLFGWDVTNRDYDIAEFTETGSSGGSSSGSGGGGCVDKDTLILIDLLGNTKKASEIKKDEGIMGMTLTGPRLFRVSAVYVKKEVKKISVINLSDDTSLKVTPNHPILTPDGYKALNNDLYPKLEVNDWVIKYNKNVRVVSITEEDYDDTVYNFLTELDNYIANGVVVATEDASTDGYYIEPDGQRVKFS